MIDLFHHPNDEKYPIIAVSDFCEEVSRYVGMAFAVAVNSGTSALHLALLSAGVGPGDRVLCPAVTFVSPINAVKYCGATPVFYEIEGDYRVNLYGQSLDGVKAMIVVDLLGHLVHPGVYRPFKQRGIKIIEDACEAMGSKYLSPAERDVDYCCLSFNWNKIITTGSGGMVLTNKTAAYTRLFYLSEQAKDDRTYYYHYEVGYNYKMNSAQAEMGLEEMGHIEDRLLLKREIARRYFEAFPAQFIHQRFWNISNYWLCAIRVPNRDAVIRHLVGKGIGCRPLWAAHAPYPESVRLVQEAVCLPSHPWLLPEDQAKVIKEVKACL